MKRIWWLIVLLAVLLLVGTTTVFGASPQTWRFRAPFLVPRTSSGQVVAVVNGMPLTLESIQAGMTMGEALVSPGALQGEATRGGDPSARC